MNNYENYLSFGTKCPNMAFANVDKCVFTWPKISAKQAKPWVNSAVKLFWDRAFFLKRGKFRLSVQQVAFIICPLDSQCGTEFHILLPFFWQNFLNMWWFRSPGSNKRDEFYTSRQDFFQSCWQSLRCRCMMMLEAMGNPALRSFVFHQSSKTRCVAKHCRNSLCTVSDRHRHLETHPFSLPDCVPHRTLTNHSWIQA